MDGNSKGQRHRVDVVTQNCDTIQKLPAETWEKNGGGGGADL